MKSYFLTLLFIAYLRGGSCIDCFQCKSTDLNNPYQCGEFMDEDDVNIQAEPCTNVFNARYCIKHTGRSEGGLGTKRFCSALDLGNYCNYIRQPGDQLEYRSCVYTCSSDGCNSSWMDGQFCGHKEAVDIKLVDVKSMDEKSWNRLQGRIEKLQLQLMSQCSN